MLLPDGTTFMHGKVPYDKNKAHDYYIRTRKLKGRKKASPDQLKRLNNLKKTLDSATLAKRPARKPDGFLKKPVPGSKKTLKKPVVELKKDHKKSVNKKSDSPVLKVQKVAAAKQVTSLRKQLSELNAKLKEKLSKAKEAEQKAKKGSSVSDLAQKAQDSKKYRAENQQKIKAQSKQAASGDNQSAGSKSTGPKSTGPKSDSVDSLKTEIAGVQKKLETAIDRQRALSITTKN